MAGAQPVVLFWYEWGIHVMVSLSFLVQVTLLLLADIRRRKDWAVVKVIIWLGYTAADTTAVYALGHMSVLARTPEHHLMALWAPLLLVHLGGQDNITAYAIEDNRLWLRHLQTFVVQVLGAAYVLYTSSSLPSWLRRATIAMSVVGVLKYGERVWSLWSADKYSSSSLSATSYKDFQGEHKEEDSAAAAPIRRQEEDPPEDDVCIIAHSLLHVPKQMFKGPTRYVKIDRSVRTYTAEYMYMVVGTQLSMMYDLLYTKAAVVHTWCGVFIRVISLPLTVASLLMFHAAMRRRRGEDAVYREEDVTVTNVLLTGAVVLEAMSILRAVFSTWTVALMSKWKWHKLARMFASAERRINLTVMQLYRSGAYWSGDMRQHSISQVLDHSGHSTGSKMATWMGREDWWDSMFYSESTPVQQAIIDKVLDLVSTAKDGEVDHISRAQGLHAVGKIKNEQLSSLISGFQLELADSILVWHIATTAYIGWCYIQRGGEEPSDYIRTYIYASYELSNYVFFLLAARPYMLPYPVTRESYVQLCHDAVGGDPLMERYSIGKMIKAILAHKDPLMEGSPVNNSPDRRSEQRSTNITWDKGYRLAKMLIHMAHMAQDGNVDDITAMIFQVWVEMLCYTAYKCDEKSHAQNLTNGGDIMTIVALLMVYMSNGFIEKTNEASSSGGATGDGTH